MSENHFHSRDARFVWVLSLLQLISWGSVFYGFALFMVPLEQALGIQLDVVGRRRIGFSCGPLD